jgi:hypothetical protein
MIGIFGIPESSATYQDIAPNPTIHFFIVASLVYRDAVIAVH